MKTIPSEHLSAFEKYLVGLKHKILPPRFKNEIFCVDAGDNYQLSCRKIDRLDLYYAVDKALYRLYRDFTTTLQETSNELV